MRNLLFLWLVLISFLGGSFAAMAQDDAQVKLNTSRLAQIPILHEGRIKPLDSFARAQLRSLSGKESGAFAWLLETIFDPARSEMRPVLKVTNPEIQTLLHLENRKSKLYSYQEVSRALKSKQKIILSIVNAQEKDWSPQQRDLITLQTNLVSLQKLLGSLTLFLPLSMTLPDTANDALKPYAGKQLTYVDALEFQGELHDAVKAIISEKGNDIEAYTIEEQALAHLSFSLNLLQGASSNNDILNIIPIDAGTWLSPWKALPTQSAQPLFKHWAKLSVAYHHSDAKKWSAAIDDIYGIMNAAQNVRVKALSAEYYYNLYNPFYISFLACLFGIVVLIASIFWAKTPTIIIVFPLLISSLILQISGVFLRIFILDRAPVSTLYETILFVSLITALYTLSAYYKDRKSLWLWLCSGLGIFFYILGLSHSADGDNFVMLSAVLNTNFWLTTHVLGITVGYAFCALTSILAHYALVKKMLGKSKAIEASLLKNVQSAAILALFFATIGTVLGGIWADQSWGRFWGWDPKENGALLIVLWLIWVLHGRISGQMKQVPMLCAMAYLSVILAISWFGVNLLSVGLHAYGFTDSAVWSLGAFIAAQTIFIIGAIFFLHKKRIEDA